MKLWSGVNVDGFEDQMLRRAQALKNHKPENSYQNRKWQSLTFLL